ncbi:hypothetical protein D3C77_425800 [compost metagenome]
MVDLNDGAQRLNFRYTRQEMRSGLMITQGRYIDPTLLDKEPCGIRVGFAEAIVDGVVSDVVLLSVLLWSGSMHWLWP